MINSFGEQFQSERESSVENYKFKIFSRPSKFRRAYSLNEFDPIVQLLFQFSTKRCPKDEHQQKQFIFETYFLESPTNLDYSEVSRLERTFKKYFQERKIGHQHGMPHYTVNICESVLNLLLK